MDEKKTLDTKKDPLKIVDEKPENIVYDSSLNRSQNLKAFHLDNDPNILCIKNLDQSQKLNELKLDFNKLNLNLIQFEWSPIFDKTIYLLLQDKKSFKKSIIWLLSVDFSNENDDQKLSKELEFNLSNQIHSFSISPLSCNRS